MSEPTCFNPVWYRDDWMIYLSALGRDPFKYYYIHRDCGANDIRSGYATSIEDAKKRIDTRYPQ